MNPLLAWVVFSFPTTAHDAALGKAARDLTSDKETLRSTAFEAIETLAPEVYTPLREYALSTKPGEKARAATALEILGQQAKPAVPLITKHFQSAIVANDLNRNDIATFSTLSRILLNCKAGDKQLLDLMKLGTTPKASHQLRRIAFDFLVVWAGDDENRRKDVAPILAEAIGTITSPLRLPAIQQAGQWGASSKDLLPDIKKLKLATDEKVRSAATDAAAQIEESMQRAKPVLAANQVRITKKEFGDAWPFTVEEGILTGNGSKGVGTVTFTANGKTYGVNGLARGAKQGFANVEEIWAFAPGSDKIRINIGPIIERGLELCGAPKKPK